MSTNPYQSPAEETPANGGDVGAAEGDLLNWLWVFAINLPLPLFLATGMLGFRGWIGSGIAIVSLLFLGAAAVERFSQTMLNIRQGGTTVALSQFFPIIHIVVGGGALLCLDFLGLMDVMGFSRPIDTVTGGFLGTAITGVALMFVAWIIGFRLRATRRKTNP